MIEKTDIKPHTCGTCLNWNPNKNNLGPGNTLQLNSDLGTCNAAPPVPVAVATGNGQVGFTSVYPVTPAQFPACGLYDDEDAFLEEHLHD